MCRQDANIPQHDRLTEHEAEKHGKILGHAPLARSVCEAQLEQVGKHLVSRQQHKASELFTQKCRLNVDALTGKRKRVNAHKKTRITANSVRQREKSSLLPLASKSSRKQRSREVERSRERGRERGRAREREDGPTCGFPPPPPKKKVVAAHLEMRQEH